jgi:hypothetical protein
MTTPNIVIGAAIGLSAPSPSSQARRAQHATRPTKGRAHRSEPTRPETRHVFEAPLKSESARKTPVTSRV